MVRHICITNEIAFQNPDHRIISLNEFIEGETGIDKKTNVCVFDDMTSNFEDLGYWDSERDLGGKTMSEVQQKIEELIIDLQNKGFYARKLTIEDEASITYPNWIWGHKKKSGRSQNLSNYKRISVLMFHLNNLLEISQKYTQDYKFFLQSN